MNSIHSAFKRERNLLNISQAKLAKELGVTQSQIAKIETGKSAVTMEMVDKMVKLGANFSDIIGGGEGSMLKPEKDEATISTNLHTNHIPLVSQYAYAGYLCGFADEEYMETLPLIPWDVEGEPKGSYIGFEVRGDSMDDRSYESILDGDILYCRRLKEDLWRYKLHFNDWDFVIVHKKDGILVKRIIEHNTETGDIRIHSLNPLYEDKIINIQDVSQIFNVVEIKRRRKR